MGYDHVAGQLGVALSDALVARSVFEVAPEMIQFRRPELRKYRVRSHVSPFPGCRRRIQRTIASKIAVSTFVKTRLETRCR